MDSKDIIPVGLHLLIETIKAEERSAGGIILPDQVKDQKNMSATRAKILAKGDDAFCDYNPGSSMPSIGDDVIIARYAGLVLETKEGNHRICTDGDVIAVIRKD